MSSSSGLSATSASRPGFRAAPASSRDQQARGRGIRAGQGRPVDRELQRDHTIAQRLRRRVQMREEPQRAVARLVPPAVTQDDEAQSVAAAKRSRKTSKGCGLAGRPSLVSASSSTSSRARSPQSPATCRARAISSRSRMRQELGARRGAPLGRHEDGRPQDRRDLPALRDRRRHNAAGGRGQARGGCSRRSAAPSLWWSR